MSVVAFGPRATWSPNSNDAPAEGGVTVPLVTGPARDELEARDEDESETREDGAGPSVVQDGPSSPEAVDLRTVDPQTARSAKNAGSSDDERPSKRTKRRAAVTFGEVEIFTHAPALDGSKVPRDGRAPMGLGLLESVDLRRMVSYDHERLAARRVRRVALARHSHVLHMRPLSGGRPSECTCGSASGYTGHPGQRAHGDLDDGRTASLRLPRPRRAGDRGEPDGCPCATGRAAYAGDTVVFGQRVGRHS